jgi:rod shape-determining protein MreC
MRLAWWSLIVLAVGVVSIFLSEAGTIDPARNLTLTASAPVEAVLRDAASPIDDIYEGIADRGDLARENERLRTENEELRAALAAQEDAQARISELEDALGVKQRRPDDQLMAANVIAQEPSALKHMVAIDRGTDDGLDEGMIILSRSGSLVGTVARVYDKYAWVRLITDPSSAVNAQVNATGATLKPSEEEQATPTPAPAEGSPSPTATPKPEKRSVRGVAQGDLRVGVLLDLLPPDVEIAVESLVMTSGLGGNYPPGILIGSVGEVEQRVQSAFKRATVEPAAQLNELETVLVLISFQPARLTSP